jgi:hypothetical protein
VVYEACRHARQRQRRVLLHDDVAAYLQCRCQLAARLREVIVKDRELLDSLRLRDHRAGVDGGLDLLAQVGVVDHLSLFQQPRKTMWPFTRSSQPGAIRMVQPGIGRPTVPIFCATGVLELFAGLDDWQG